MWPNFYKHETWSGIGNTYLHAITDICTLVRIALKQVLQTKIHLDVSSSCEISLDTVALQRLTGQSLQIFFLRKSLKNDFPHSLTYWSKSLWQCIETILSSNLKQHLNKCHQRWKIISKKIAYRALACDFLSLCFALLVACKFLSLCIALLVVEFDL